MTDAQTAPRQSESPLDSLRRGILALLAVMLFMLLVPGGVLLFFEQDESRTRDRIIDFHGPTLAAAQDALLVLDDLRLEPDAPPQGDMVAWQRRQRLLLNQLEQRLRRIVDLQQGVAWPASDATVRRLGEPLAAVEHAVDPRAEPLEHAVPLPTLRVTLDQLRLLHQDEQVMLLRLQAGRGRTFSRIVMPLLLALLAGAIALGWVVWRGIGQSLAREVALHEGLVKEIAERRQAETDLRAAQEQLVQSQKLEAVGRLAGGIAHDFNNLLLVIKGYVEMAMAAIPPGSQAAADLAEVNTAADSAAALTAQMLTFSRRQIIAPVVLDVNSVVTRVRGMLTRVLGEDVALRINTAPDLWRVRFDPGQAEQILMNLAVNARDAMPGGGQLTIETANMRLTEEYVREHLDSVPGDYVMLAVSDTGIGMTTEAMAHVFEPFYTTKVAGHGTGLGLAIIHGAVSQNGGRIELYSEPGHGTTFKIYLPRALEAATATVTPDAPPAPPRGTETILLVEDDAAVRALAVRVLERQGYRVHAFASGADVLQWLHTSTEPIHLLLSDVIMPGMNGKELADRVAAVRPGTKVLYVSGYTANVIVHHGVGKSGMDFLAKPYTREGLSQRVRQVLDHVDPSTT